MFNIFFKKYENYKIEEKAEQTLINKYQNKLPDELLTFWINFGFGTFMNGYLKIINPDLYQDSLNNSYLNPENEIIFGITAFGDYLVWTGDAIRLIKFRYGTYTIIENDDDMTWFFDMDLADDSYVKHNLYMENYALAKEKLGELNYDECYGYTPILSLGGPEKIENLKKVKIIEHIAIITELNGKIE